jgi:hypothetical protein
MYMDSGFNGTKEQIAALCSTEPEKFHELYVLLQTLKAQLKKYHDALPPDGEAGEMVLPWLEEGIDHCFSLLGDDITADASNDHTAAAEAFYEAQREAIKMATACQMAVDNGTIRLK